MALAANRRVQLKELRERLRLLMAVVAVMVLIAGLTCLIVLVLSGRMDETGAIIVFIPFFLVGLLLFAASAFINAEIVKYFTNYLSSAGGARRD